MGYGKVMLRELPHWKRFTDVRYHERSREIPLMKVQTQVQWIPKYIEDVRTMDTEKDSVRYSMNLA